MWDREQMTLNINTALVLHVPLPPAHFSQTVLLDGYSCVTFTKLSDLFLFFRQQHPTKYTQVLSLGVYCFISICTCTVCPYSHFPLESSFDAVHRSDFQPSGLALPVPFLLCPKPPPFFQYPKVVPHFILIKPNFSSTAANNKVRSLPPHPVIYIDNATICFQYYYLS